MRVRFQVMQARVDLWRVLRSDGWALERGWRDDIVAAHPDAADEPAARARLLRLGLLISRVVRIEFMPTTGRRPG
jgi:hypothetical protein